MPLNLEEAEAAAYLDPSQENLAVYVKLLEEQLTEMEEQLTEMGEQITEMEEQITEMERAAPL